MFKKMTKDQKKECIVDFAVGFVIGAVATGIGYAIGQQDAMRAVAKGIDKCWKADPTLREHMWSAVEKVKSLQK